MSTDSPTFAEDSPIPTDLLSFLDSFIRRLQEFKGDSAEANHLETAFMFKGVSWPSDLFYPTLRERVDDASKKRRIRRAIAADPELKANIIKLRKFADTLPVDRKELTELLTAVVNAMIAHEITDKESLGPLYDLQGGLEEDFPSHKLWKPIAAAIKQVRLFRATLINPRTGKSRPRRGRKPQFNADEDNKLRQDYESSGIRSVKEFARMRGKPRVDVEASLKRTRARRSRNKNRPSSPN